MTEANEIAKEEAEYLGKRLALLAAATMGFFVTPNMSYWWIPLMLIVGYAVGTAGMFMLRMQWRAAKQSPQPEREQRPPINFNIGGNRVAVMHPHEDEDEWDDEVGVRPTIAAREAQGV